MAEQGKEGMLPKNIRQIGQISGNQKIYLEDYVITYLRQILTPDENMRVMILYGHKEMIEDELYWFVNGAVEAQHDFFMEKTIIDEESWKKVNEMAGKFFPELTVMGWAITREDSTEDLEEQIMRTQRQFFRPDQKLYFEYITSDKTEALYLHEKGKRNMLSGYYIYYERNECRPCGAAVPGSVSGKETGSAQKEKLCICNLCQSASCYGDTGDRYYDAE